MILDVGSKVLVVHRRLYDKDKSRYFVGVVDQCEAGLARVTGHTWVQDPFDGAFLKKEDMRTKIIALSSTGIITYALPNSVQLSDLQFEFSDKGQLALHDRKKFRMDLSETCHAE